MDSQKPEIHLLDYTHNAFNLSIASARTCYSSKGILLPDEMDKSAKSIAIRDKVAKSTKKAGHLTTRQHPQFIFTINNVSRQFVWAFLHSHPYYNSEQVSQRYVEVKTENFYIPSSLEAKQKELYLQAIEVSTQAYSEFLQTLQPYVAKEYFAIYKARASYPEKWQKPIKKKCLEIARYFLPLATHTYLFHTINGLTLHRYHRLSEAYHVPEEQREVITAMVDAVRRVDPLFVEEMDDPAPLHSTVEYQLFENFYGKRDPSSAFVQEFDADLAGSYARLVSYSDTAESVLASSVRAVLGLATSEMTDSEAILQVLSAEKNPSLVSTLNETTLSPLSRAMFNVNYTFQKRISHTADSQDQRHRMVPGARPILFSQYTGEADYITPALVQKYPELQTAYEQKMTEIFTHIERFAEACPRRDLQTYLLPNAFPVRFYESGDLLNLYHKWKSRLCYNAQEEIFYASLQEVEAVQKIHPRIGEHLRAPCWVREQGGTKPFCPEGDKYCGVRVWKQKLQEYQRVL